MTSKNVERHLEKISDAVVEIDVSLKRMLEELEEGYYTEDACKQLVVCQKSLRKIGTYLFRLPEKDVRKTRKKNG